MSLSTEFQKLTPGTRIVLVNIGDELLFHPHKFGYTETQIQAAQASGTDLPAHKIVFANQSYTPWPCQIEGIESSSDGTAAQPTLTVANLDGSVSALCLDQRDLLGKKVRIRYTLSDYLDAVNFDGGVNPDADPTEFVDSVWYIEQKTSEDESSVVFALSSPVDFGGMKIPARQITTYCQWMLSGDYRGADCGYTGTNYFDKVGNVVATAAEDVCGGCLADCKLRFPSGALPFGGFSAAGLSE